VDWIANPQGLQGTYDDVDIRIFQEGDASRPESVSFYADMNVANTNHRCTGVLPCFPEEKWLQITDTVQYGTELFRWLFPPKSELEAVFLQARWRSEGTQRSSQAKIRLKLWLDPASPSLHRLWWEAMYDPEREVPLALTVAFSRFHVSDRRALPVAARPLRMLLATSNPQGLDKFDCQPLDMSFEQELIQRATRGLGDSLATTQLTNPTPEGLKEMLNELRPHIVYLNAQSIYDDDDDDSGRVLLPDHTGMAAPVPFSDLVKIVAPSPDAAPQFVFLTMPSKAEVDFYHSLSTLGRRLVESGTQAAVALQAPMAEQGFENFIPQFFEVLGRRGVIDEAMMLARSRIYEPGHWSWSFPVLYMSTPDAVLFQPLSPELEEGIRALKFVNR
jgi:hypothetical protein